MSANIAKGNAEEAMQQAAQWMARLWSEEANNDDVMACKAWRAAQPCHEQAWQNLQAFDQKLQQASAFSVRSEVLDAPGIAITRRKLLLQYAGLTVAAGGLTYGLPRTNLWQQYSSDYASSVGETRSEILVDGTQLILNTNSAVSINFTAELRTVIIHHGEVLITTATDPGQRPFVVQSQQGLIRALGTRFSVRQKDNSTSIAVFESAVEIMPNSSSQVQRLEVGQGASFTDNTISQITIVNDNQQSWSTGRLIAERMRLADFAAEISRYRHGLVRYKPEVADLRISGVFSLNDTDRALTNMASSLPVRVVYRTRYWVSIEAQ